MQFSNRAIDEFQNTLTAGDDVDSPDVYLLSQNKKEIIQSERKINFRL